MKNSEQRPDPLRSPRTRRVTYPDTTYEEIDYNRLDISGTRDREGRWAHYWHDAGRQLRLARDPEGRTTQYDWCSCGSLGALTDGEGNKTRWEYDLQGRMTAKVYPDQTEWLYNYDRTGRLKQVIDAAGNVKDYAYHLDDNLHRIEYAVATGFAATPGVEFEYQTYVNRLWKTHVHRTSTPETTTYSYHPFGSTGGGRVASITDGITGAVLGYTYDNVGRLLTRQIDGSANDRTYVYDGIGQITSETNPLGTFTFDWVNPKGRLDQILYPNGQKAQFAYHGVKRRLPAANDREPRTGLDTGPAFDI